MEKLAASFQRWMAYSLDQISDVSFWWGAATTLLGLIGIAALPAIRGAIAPLTGGVSRIFTGYFYFRRASYPDIVSATQHILLRHPDGSPDIAAYGRIAHRERDAAAPRHAIFRAPDSAAD